MNSKKIKKRLQSRHSKDSRNRAEDILALIRQRERENRVDRYIVPEWEKAEGIWRHRRKDTVKNRPMTADTWQKFKRDFIAKYDGEDVRETGFTDSEFLEWFKTGKRELHREPSKLQALLAELHAHDDATEGDDDEE